MLTSDHFENTTILSLMWSVFTISGVETCTIEKLNTMAFNSPSDFALFC